jgi:hypothetical protein
MDRFSRFRPSPAMIVACAALFVALGGVGYAAATIGSSQIKNNSVRGKDIRNSTITGKDVKNSGLTGSDVKNSSLGGADVKSNSLTGNNVLESSLGKVNSASTADSAGTVNGQKKLLYRATAGGAAQEIYNDGRLKLTASCGTGGALTLTANTSVDHAAVSSYGRSSDTNDDDFLTSESLTVSAADDERDLVYTTSDGRTTVLQWGASESDGGSDPFGQANTCAVSGWALAL